MIDIKKHEFEQEAYVEFVGYLKSTWGCFLDGDWKEEIPTIQKIVVTLKSNRVTAFVYLAPCVYYEWTSEKGLYEVEYTGLPIKVSYDLDNIDLLYMLLNCDIISDLGLEDIEFVVSEVSEYGCFDELEYDKDLTKRLRDIEMDYGYDAFCREHDL